MKTDRFYVSDLPVFDAQRAVPDLTLGRCGPLFFRATPEQAESIRIGRCDLLGSDQVDAAEEIVPLPQPQGTRAEFHPVACAGAACCSRTADGSLPRGAGRQHKSDRDPLAELLRDDHQPGIFREEYFADSRARVGEPAAKVVSAVAGRIAVASVASAQRLRRADRAPH